MIRKLRCTLGTATTLSTRVLFALSLNLASIVLSCTDNATTQSPVGSAAPAAVATVATTAPASPTDPAATSPVIATTEIQPAITGIFAIDFDDSGPEKETPVEGAVVMLEGHPEVSAITGPTGAFVIAVVSIGEGVTPATPGLNSLNLLDKGGEKKGEVDEDLVKKPFALVANYEKDGKTYAKRLTNLVYTGGRILDLGNLTLAETGAISGKVTLSDGASALGIDVYVPGTSHVAKAAEDGSFVMLYVPEGEYKVIYEKVGYSFGSTASVVVLSKRVTDLDPVKLKAKDLSPPDTTISSGPSTVSGSQIATIVFTSSEGASDFLCKLDNALYSPCRTPHTLTGLGEGAHTMSVTAIDGAGNVDGSAAAWQWTIDLTAPLLVVEEKPSQITAQTTAAFRFSTSEAAATIECQLDGTAVACGLTSNFPNLAPGLHAILVTAIDPAGNKSPAKVISWQIDTSVINTTALSAPPTLTNQTTATVIFSANKSATFVCKLDSGTSATCLSPYTVSNLGQGPHTVSIVATDLAGNVDATPLDVSWTIDAEAPNAPTTTAVAGNLTNDPTPTLQWSTGPADTARYELDVDVGPSFNSTMLRQFTNITTTTQEVRPQLPDGTWYFRVRAIDQAGNASPWSAARSFELDTQSPSVPVAGYLPDPFNDTRPTFVWQSATDAVRYRLVVANDGTFAAPTVDKSDITSTTFQPLAALASGATFWKVAAIDTAGNQSQYSLALLFNLDTSAPGTPAANVVASPTKVTAPAFSWSAVTGAAHYNFQMSSDSVFTSLTINDASITATVYTSSALTDNVYYWRVSAIDSAGNHSGFSAPQTLVIDTLAPPAPTLAAYTPSPGNDLTPTLVWSNPGAGAVTYDILIKQGATTLVTNTGISQLNYTPSSALPTGTITWQVRARDAAGNTGAYSASSSFVLTSAASWKLKFLGSRAQFPYSSPGDFVKILFQVSAPPIYIGGTTWGQFLNNQWAAASVTNGAIESAALDSSGRAIAQKRDSSVSSGSRLFFYDNNSHSWIQTTVIVASGNNMGLVDDGQGEIHTFYYNQSPPNGVYHRKYSIGASTWGSEAAIRSGGSPWPITVNSPNTFPGVTSDGAGKVSVFYYLYDIGIWEWQEYASGGWSVLNSFGGSNTDFWYSDGILYQGGVQTIRNVSNGSDLKWNGASFATVAGSYPRIRAKAGGASGEKDTFVDYYSGGALRTFPIEDDIGTVWTDQGYSNPTPNWTDSNAYQNPVALIRNLSQNKRELAPSVGLTTIDVTPGVGRHASAAFTAAGAPRVAYYDSTSRKLKLAERLNDAWTVNVIDTGTDVGQYAHLALKANGKGVISYYDANTGDLKVATESVSWSTYAVDTSGDVGKYADVAIRSDNNPVVAYYDATNGDLKLATFDGTSWQIEVVYSTGDVGQYASLVLDATNHPSIAYYDTTNHRLEFAAYNGTTWQFETVDAAADVGQYASLTLKSTGSPMIAYYDATNGDLKFAEKSGGIWTISTLRSTGDVGTYVSLKRDSADHPHVAFYDATSKDLVYGNRDGIWAFRTIDGDETSTQDKGMYSSIAINPTNSAPSAAYYDAVEGGVSFVEGMVLY